MTGEGARSRGAGWLVLGLSIVGLTVGYMVGGSATPVVGVALPLFFGLVPIGMEALKKRAERERQQELAAVLPTVADPEERKAVLAAMLRPPEAWASLRDVGIALVAIGVAVAVGSVAGGLARVRGIYRASAPPAAPLPWESSAVDDGCRVSMSAVVRFVNLREDLLALGYSSAQVRQIYDRTRDEWCTPPALPWAGDASCAIGRQAAFDYLALQQHLVDLGYPRSTAIELFERARAQWCRPDTAISSTRGERRGAGEDTTSGTRVVVNPPSTTGTGPPPFATPLEPAPVPAPVAPLVHERLQLRDVANQRRRERRE